jgi:hypothetical protein
MVPDRSFTVLRDVSAAWTATVAGQEPVHTRGTGTDRSWGPIIPL